MLLSRRAPYLFHGAFILLALLLSSPATAEEVTIEYKGLTLNAEYAPGDGASVDDRLILIVHGTLAHNAMETIANLSAILNERGLNTLAINLSLGVDNRHGMYDCAVPHRHTHLGALGEIDAWITWAQEQGSGPITLFGHSRGGNQVAQYTTGGGASRLERVVLMAPATWNEKEAAAGYEKNHGTPLGAKLAEALYTKFMALLVDTITEKGGSLSMDDVAEMGETFREHMGDIKETFLHAVESYAEAREETRVSSERGNVFHRLMVHQFEDRFVNERTLKDKPLYLSRRMLPGFYNAMSMMFGPPKLERYERQASMVVDRMRKETNGQLEWHDVYKTAEARRISIRAQIDIARHFKDVDKRLDWFIAMVNSNMIPLEDGRIPSGWSFTKEAAEALLCELFHDLRAALASEATRQKFADELGGETVQVLDMVVKRFS